MVHRLRSRPNYVTARSLSEWTTPPQHFSPTALRIQSLERYRKGGELLSSLNSWRQQRESYKSEELTADGLLGLVNLKCFAGVAATVPMALRRTAADLNLNRRSKKAILSSTTDVTQAAELIGRPAIVQCDPRFQRLVASLDVAIIRAMNPIFSKPFIFHLLSDERFTAHAYSHTSGTTVLHLGKEVFNTYLGGEFRNNT